MRVLTQRARAQGPAAAAAVPALWRSTRPVNLALKLPLSQLQEGVSAWAEASYQQMISGQAARPAPFKPVDFTGTVAVGEGASSPVRVRAKGNSSLGTYSFPKLKVSLEKGQQPSELEGVKSFAIGTHGFGDTAAEANARPLNEAATYQLLGALGIETLKARAASITYLDGTKRVGPKNAMLLEDADAAAKRLSGTKVDLEEVKLPLAVDPAHLIRCEVAHLLTGNVDYLLSVNEAGQLTDVWNSKLIRVDGANTLMVIPNDFDRSAMASGFALSRDVLTTTATRLERLQQQFPAVFEEVRSQLVGHKAQALESIGAASVSPAQRRLMKQNLERFLGVLEGTGRPPSVSTARTRRAQGTFEG